MLHLKTIFRDVVLAILSSRLSWAAEFPVRIAAQVKEPRPNATVQVFLEKDGGGHWQQYLASAAVSENGGFEIPADAPGLYWIIASEETDWSYRRGACLVEVNPSGAYRVKPVPNTKTGRKWGGPQSTAMCKRSVVPLTVYRSKPSTRKPR